MLGTLSRRQWPSGDPAGRSLHQQDLVTSRPTGSPAGPRATQRLRALSAPPRGTWPWPPALQPPPHPGLRVFARSGRAADSRRTFPSAAALPGVQTGGCRPGSRERTAGRGSLPGGWGGGPAEPGSGLFRLRRRSRLAAQPQAALPRRCHRHPFLTHITLERTQDTQSATSSRESDPHPPQGLHGSCLDDTIPSPGMCGVCHSMGIRPQGQLR